MCKKYFLILLFSFSRLCQFQKHKKCTQKEFQGFICAYLLHKYHKNLCCSHKSLTTTFFSLINTKCFHKDNPGVHRENLIFLGKIVETFIDSIKSKIYWMNYWGGFEPQIAYYKDFRGEKFYYELTEIIVVKFAKQLWNLKNFVNFYFKYFLV